MRDKKPGPLSSRDVLQRIGLDDDSHRNLLLDEDDLLGSPLDGLAAALKQRFESLNTPHRFKPGDIVRWKSGFQNRLFPRTDKVAIVLEVLPEPIFDSEKDSSCTYFREPLDIVLGLFLDSGPHRGDFLSWHFDSRRFELWTEGDAQ
ncbi:hypothetical protein [Azoarcus sp. KH32C]|uniref:hypothetical protein n=1 Tax=Azoarcus sp. KH32C TaxID=748247 RepID=UPI0002385EA8|nr:hypothetical protein [Azoarcus sp. KH32C]BAL23467.1 hypothetical protein AZKH_1138 [Azoarcus sp. KH32C]